MLGTLTRPRGGTLTTAPAAGVSPPPGGYATTETSAVVVAVLENTACVRLPDVPIADTYPLVVPAIDWPSSIAGSPLVLFTIDAMAWNTSVPNSAMLPALFWTPVVLVSA